MSKDIDIEDIVYLLREISPINSAEIIGEVKVFQLDNTIFNTSENFTKDDLHIYSRLLKRWFSPDESERDIY